MLKGISDSLQVQQRSQTVAPTTAMQHPAKEQAKVNVASIPSHRLESYDKWAKVTQGQHKISAQQVAEHGLQQVQTLLKQLQNHSQQSLTSNNSDSLSQAQQLQQQLAGLNISYQGTQLVDHQLNLISTQRPVAKYSFSLKSVDLIAVNSRDEQVNMHIGNDTVRVLLPANAQPAELLKRLDSSLKPLDIRVVKSNEGRVIFKSNKQQWQQIQSGLLMTGQGQRLPAGDARTIKVSEELSWQDPREWRFNSPQELKQTVAKISKTRHKVEGQLQELNHSQRHIQQQLHQANRQKDTLKGLDSTLNQVKSLMQPAPFSLQVTSLMAQANFSRAQVSSLLT
ncbi:hypothetical protein CXF83_02870 [Shewanella sp. Choline-02u-19]|uniref:hypothetical protein n=1 Tax=unclassified Shewanella TaxID=196818 RepID=UPI000C332B5B|nr:MULTISPECIES: hypothetical protein [unclassified Shewanella]PKH57274.1 hypothetical protein CXF84_09885 [Shewanella sp. Bg11-22]PKI29612.1 hypothetical protein CXF83_02870 [Shewanella sp. Choline-02u-19]